MKLKTFLVSLLLLFTTYYIFIRNINYFVNTKNNVIQYGTCIIPFSYDETNDKINVHLNDNFSFHCLQAKNITNKYHYIDLLYLNYDLVKYSKYMFNNADIYLDHNTDYIDEYDNGIIYRVYYLLVDINTFDNWHKLDDLTNLNRNNKKIIDNVIRRIYTNIPSDDNYATLRYLIKNKQHNFNHLDISFLNVAFMDTF